MRTRETKFQHNQLARVARFEGADGWKLQRIVEEDAERNCNGLSLETFFPTTDEWGQEPGRLRERERIAETCSGCPVADECLAGALLRGERFGGWGGVAQPDFQELGRLWRRRQREMGPQQEAA